MWGDIAEEIREISSGQQFVLKSIQLEDGKAQGHPAPLSTYYVLLRPP